MTSDQIAHLNFMKQQQWTSTYYIMLLFSGMFAIKRTFEPPLGPSEKCIGTMVALFVLAIGVLFLAVIQYDIGKFRKTLDRDDLKPYVRGLEFTIPLSLTMLAGAATVIYYFWR